MTLRIKKLRPDTILPTYAHPGDAGIDVYASEKVILPPGERRLIPTGIAVAIPVGHVGLIWDRSGLAVNHGLTTLAGVIDETYRGEIKIAVYNSSKDQFTVEKGMRIAQMLIQPVEQPQIVEVQELNDTIRGSRAFGSSGLK